jgi:hypothetical protein
MLFIFQSCAKSITEAGKGGVTARSLAGEPRSSLRGSDEVFQTNLHPERSNLAQCARWLCYAEGASALPETVRRQLRKADIECNRNFPAMWRSLAWQPCKLNYRDAQRSWWAKPQATTSSSDSVIVLLCRRRPIYRERGTPAASSLIPRIISSSCARKSRKSPHRR